MKKPKQLLSILINICIIFEVFEACSTKENIEPNIVELNKNAHLDETPIKKITQSTISTSTISFDTCIIKNRQSNLFGSYNQGYSNDTFDVNITDLSSIVIYSGQFVHSIQFNFANGDSILYGEDKNKVSITLTTTIDLIEKQIAAVHVRSGWWIDNVQFLIYDQISKIYTWTSALGGHGGLVSLIDMNNIAPQASNFQIVSILGSVAPDDSNIATLQFRYSYEVCNPAKPIPTYPPIPPSLRTTTLITDPYYTDSYHPHPPYYYHYWPNPYPGPYYEPYQYPDPYPNEPTLLSTTTVLIGTCVTKNRQSNLFGSYNQGYSNDTFDFNITDLSSIVIYSGQYVHSIQFNFANGVSILYGEDKNKVSITLTTTIDLIDKQISAVHVRSGWWIDNVQFLIYDQVSNIYTWTSALGGDGGGESFIDIKNIAPKSSDFHIVSISGSVAPDDSDIATLQFRYSYKVCNLAEPTTVNTVTLP